MVLHSRLGLKLTFNKIILQRALHLNEHESKHDPYIEIYELNVKVKRILVPLFWQNEKYKLEFVAVAPKNLWHIFSWDSEINDDHALIRTGHNPSITEKTWVSLFWVTHLMWIQSPEYL